MCAGLPYFFPLPAPHPAHVYPELSPSLDFLLPLPPPPTFTLHASARTPAREPTNALAKKLTILLVPTLQPCTN